MKINSFQEALTYLYQHIPVTPKTEFPGELGLHRMEALMHELGDPQEKIKVIHIAGTSGKGSTSYILSNALASQGKKVGLHLSPHIMDIRERCMVNNRYLSSDTFVQYLNELIPAIEQVSLTDYGSPTYFEILVALAFHTFYRERCEYAVIETGLGGLYDGTNVVRNPDKIVLLTPIGRDHVKVLGNTLAKIAYQKAGIIHPGNSVISAPQATSVRTVFNKSAHQNNASISYLEKGKTYSNVEVSKICTRFEFSMDEYAFQTEVGLLGIHQVQNASLAIAAAIEVLKREQKELNIPELQKVLKGMRFPGRFDICQREGKTLVLDGAHNPQKMKSFLRSLRAVFPDSQMTFLIAFKKGKEAKKMIEMISEYAQELYLSVFFVDKQDMPQFAWNAEDLRLFITRKGLPVYTSDNPEQGLNMALKSASQVIVITGSLYFISEIYPLLDSATHNTDL